MSRLRISRRGCVAVGAAMMLAGAAPAAIAATARPAPHRAAPGSKLGGVDLEGTAYAVRAPLYSTGGEDVELEAPYADSTLSVGGVGHGLTSVLWPGGTGAHGGDVLDLLGVPAPSSLKQKLNDPVKAEAQTSVGKPTVRMSGPGYSMTATATPTRTAADSQASGAQVPMVGKLLGSIESSSSDRFTGPRTAVATATSTVRDLSVAHVLTIDQITSTATATTAATTASTRTSTRITGAEVAGIPVTIDGSGIHVKGTAVTTPLGDPDKLVDQALSRAGIAVTLTRATRTVRGAAATVHSGTLRIDLASASYRKNNDTGILLVIGGVEAAADSQPSFPVAPPTPTRAGAGRSAGGTTGGSGRATRPAAGGTGSLPVPGQAGAGTAGTAPQVAAPVTRPQLAGAAFGLPGGVKVWWVVLVLLGAGLVWLGLRRLPDQVLNNRDDRCLLEQS